MPYIQRRLYLPLFEGTHPFADSSSTLALQLYKSLRDEILKRTELQQQMVSITLVAVAAFLTVGLQSDSPATALLTFPLLAFLLASAWTHHYLRVREAAAYLNELELLIGFPGWEQFIRDIRVRSGLLRYFGFMSANGIFLACQLITLLLGWTKGSSMVDSVLVAVDAVIVLLTFIISLYSRRFVIEFPLSDKLD